MNWFRENRFLGTFFVVFGVATIAALAFLFFARSGWSEATMRYENNATELARLQRLTPFPSGPNLRKMQAHADDYSSAVAKLKDELRPRMLPVAPLAPNEFQSRLRVAVNATAEKARAAKVKLPDHFFLGFEEFGSRLPDTAAAPLLGQELAQVEMLTNIMIDAHVDSIGALRLISRPDASATAAASLAKKPAGAAATAAPKLIERNVVETSFVSTPTAARRVLNAISGAGEQFFILRLVHVRNEKDKGPPREQTPEATSAATPAATPPPGKAPAGQALNFIVGNEHIETSARIEMVRFTY